MPSYTPLAVVYGTDEDIAVRDPGDYLTLVPRSQKRAEGSDGATSGWTLTSPSVDFAAQGVKAGHVAALSFPVTTSRGSSTPPPGLEAELFAVDSASGRTLTLRRVGEASGVGQPPAAASSVAFLVATLGPQIEDVSYELNRRFGVDPKIPGRTPAEFYDVREVNQVCTLTVLQRQYEAMARMAGDAKDDFWAKAKSFAQTRDDILDRLTVHWQTVTGWGVTPIEPTTTRFSTRISR